MNIKYFFMKDQIDNQKMEVEHCNTDEIVGNTLQTDSTEGQTDQI